MTIVNFSGVTDGTRLLPEGTYDAKVVDVQVKPGKAGEYYNITFEVDAGDGKGPVRVYDILSFSENSLSITWKSLSNIAGAPLAKGPFDPEAEIDRFFGRPCKLKIGPEEYNGQKRNDVQGILKADAPSIVGKGKAKLEF
jgi:ribosomal protein S28E/S33